MPPPTCTPTLELYFDMHASFVTYRLIALGWNFYIKCIKPWIFLYTFGRSIAEVSDSLPNWQIQWRGTFTATTRHHAIKWKTFGEQSTVVKIYQLGSHAQQSCSCHNSTPNCGGLYPYKSIIIHLTALLNCKSLTSSTLNCNACTLNVCPTALGKKNTDSNNVVNYNRLSMRGIIMTR